MKKKIFYLLTISLLVLSCQQLPDDDVLMDEEMEESLKVEVRSAEGAKIIYPLQLYAFGEDGQLVASQTVKKVEDEMSLPMAGGDYQVVAVSGLSDAYQMPEKLALDEEIVYLGSEAADTPLMMGRADVNIGRSADETVELTLSHVVAALNVTLKNVPKGVSEVQLTLSPLYSSISMDGTYGGKPQKVKVDCIQTSTGVWIGETSYVFPGCGKETVFSIEFKSENGTEVTYGYTYKGIPEANKPFNVTGSYSDGVIIGGDFDVNDWEGGIEVEFEFGASVTPDEEEENETDGPTTDLTGVPEVGTIWNDMIVADINEAEDGGVDLLLMSLDEWEIITSQADEVTEGYTVNGLSGWRFPNHDEAALLRARFSGSKRLELNDLIATYDARLYGLAGGEKERYLCLKEDVFYSFQFISGTRTTKAGEKRSYYARLVKTYRYED
ncbi:MAG: hypothetical protein E7096_04895 [Bacteroides sp.]|nr:hypothetical protein [Bacteroides sp.]